MKINLRRAMNGFHRTIIGKNDEHVYYLYWRYGIDECCYWVFDGDGEFWLYEEEKLFLLERNRIRT